MRQQWDCRQTTWLSQHVGIPGTATDGSLGMLTVFLEHSRTCKTIVLTMTRANSQ